MRLNEVTFSGLKPIESYGPGFFRIGGEVHEGPIVVLPDGISAWQGYEAPEPLIAAASEIDILFVGTGGEIAHIPPRFRDALEDVGIGVEIMSSPAACRTYNVLLSEGRRVALALIPV